MLRCQCTTGSRVSSAGNEIKHLYFRGRGSTQQYQAHREQTSRALTELSYSVDVLTWETMVKLTLSIFPIGPILTLVVTPLALVIPSFSIFLHVTIPIVRAAGSVSRAVTVPAIIVTVPTIIVSVTSFIITVVSVIVTLVSVVSTRRVLPTSTTRRRRAATAWRSTVPAAVATRIKAPGSRRGSPSPLDMELELKQ